MSERRYNFSDSTDDEDFEINGDYLDFVDVGMKNAVVLTKYNKKGELEEVIQGISQIKEYLNKMEGNGNKN